MHPAPYPTGRPLALHLVHGLWVASCPDCGYELGRSRDQAQAEHAGRRHRCPICHPEDPDAPVPADDDWVTVPRYRIPDHPERQAQLDDLVEWVAANGGFDPQQGPPS